MRIPGLWRWHDDSGAAHVGDFEDFYRATAARTFAVAYRATRNDRHVAWDAAQDAYIEMSCGRQATSIEDDGRYVIGIAVRKVANYYRERARFVDLPGRDDYGQDESGYAATLEKMTIPLVLQAV